MPALAAVLDAIARAVLGDADRVNDPAVTLGPVTLRPHQRDALRRLRASLERRGGALLADEPGLGKTFVALALAREHAQAVVVAPAALRAMWHEAAALAGVGVSFVSMEALSRRGAGAPGPGALVIVDEAHHASNPGTARYARLARLTAYRRVLLLSATPVRNRRAELGALLALFLGPRALAMDDAARARCIVRRPGDAALLPAIDGPHWHRVRSAAGLRVAIERLPPPLPALDGRAAGALVAITLARCWASSLAALDAALRRRVQRGEALAALLDAGRMPTRSELRAWVVGDDAVQLAFPMLAAHGEADAAALREVLQPHLAAVRALRTRLLPRVPRDTRRRAQLLLGLRAAHPGARIVAFTAHAATAEALYRALGREPGVALLTARGARTASGARPRRDVIRALGADAPRPATLRDEISMVIATDLLSEGVNLQRASVVVHLDVPWTPAGLDQRVGRAARMGSAHARVHVHGIAAPPQAARLLALDRRLRHKHAEQAAAARASLDAEQWRAFVRGWRRGDSGLQNTNGPPGPLVAHAASRRPGFIAVVRTRAELTVVYGTQDRRRHWTVSRSPADLLPLVRAVLRRAVAPDDRLEASVRAALARWLTARSAREAAGAGTEPSRGRGLVLARIDASMRCAPAHARAALAVRAARLRALVDQAVGAGAERMLVELAGSGSTDGERWLSECEALLARASSRRAAPASGGPDVVTALLLLRPRS